MPCYGLTSSLTVTGHLRNEKSNTFRRGRQTMFDFSASICVYFFLRFLRKIVKQRAAALFFIYLAIVTRSDCGCVAHFIVQLPAHQCCTKPAASYHYAPVRLCRLNANVCASLKKRYASNNVSPCFGSLPFFLDPRLPPGLNTDRKVASVNATTS